MANIAPLPALPSMVSEGGGQGLVTLACLQDLSQARRRWPGEADGLPTLFGTTVVLPGIGDVRTLEALATLAGDEEVPTRGVSSGRGPTGHLVTDLMGGGRSQVGASASTQRRRRLPPTSSPGGRSGYALAFDERNRAAWVPLAPAHRCEPWRSLGCGNGTSVPRGHDTPRRTWPADTSPRSPLEAGTLPAGAGRPARPVRPRPPVRDRGPTRPARGRERSGPSDSTIRSAPRRRTSAATSSSPPPRVAGAGQGAVRRQPVGEPVDHRLDVRRRRSPDRAGRHRRHQVAVGRPPTPAGDDGR